jgi:hypothetical protein
MHQSASGSVAQLCSKLLSYRFKAFICHFDHMKMVNDDLCLWQHKANGIEIWAPHVHTDQGDFGSIFQAVQVVGHSGLVAVAQKLDDFALLDIANDAAGLMQQVNFIDPDARAMQGGSGCCLLVGFLKNTADRTLVYTGIIGNTGKGSSERLLRNVEHQALCHHMVFVHGFQQFVEGLVTGAATVSFSDDQEGGSLASDRNIQKQLGLYLVSIQVGPLAMRAAQRHRDLLDGDLVVVFTLVYGQNTIVRPAKNVQEMLSQRKELPHKFSVRMKNPVARDGRLPRLLRVSCCHSTHFAGLWISCYGRVFPRSLPDSPKPIRRTMKWQASVFTKLLTNV